MAVINDAGYELSSEFNIDFNRGRTLAHVGFESARYTEMMAVFTTLQFHPFNSVQSNKTVNGEIVSWLDVEGYIAMGRTASELVNTVLDASFRDPEHDRITYPVVVDTFIIPAYSEMDIIHQNTIFPNDTTGLSTPHLLVGILQPHTPTSTPRYLSINVSSEIPVCDNVLTLEHIAARTAAVFYLSPYKTSSGLTVFVSGNTGQELVDELNATGIVNDIVPMHVIERLLTISKERQYIIAQLLNAHKRLYGPISNEIFISIVMFTQLYLPVTILINQQPQPMDDVLDQAFQNVQL